MNGMVVFVLLLLPSAVLAQSVVGVVSDAQSGTPLEVAFVTLFDTTGAQVASDLTDTTGTFRIKGPAPGAFRLRVRRLGYGDLEATVNLSKERTLRLRLSAVPQPIDLPGITVEATRRCTLHPVDGGLTSRLWEEASKVISIAAWTESAKTLHFRRASWKRSLDPRTLRVIDEQRETQAGFHAGSPYVSIPVEDLEQSGYIQETEDTGFVYYAPSLSGLLSRPFLENHCFHISDAPAPVEGWVGLSFKPLLVGGPPNIAGTLWLDAGTAELKRLDYVYTELPAGLRADEVGGSLEFGRIKEGPWVVRRWAIRTPVIGVRASSGIGSLGGRDTPVLIGLNETGGEVLAVRAPDGSPLLAQETPSLSNQAEGQGNSESTTSPLPSPSVAGSGIAAATDIDTPRTGPIVYVTVRDTESGRSVPDVLVRVDGNDWRTTGSNGKAPLGPISPGRHLLELQHIMFDTWADTIEITKSSGVLLWAIDLKASPIPLEPLEVDVLSTEARKAAKKGVRVDIMTRLEIDGRLSKGATDVTDLMTSASLPFLDIRHTTFIHPASAPGDPVEVPGVCIELARRRQRGCAMVSVFLDDVPLVQPHLNILGLNPHSIDRIEILQPPEATLRFGLAQGQNGAVLLYTRRGPG